MPLEVQNPMLAKMGMRSTQSLSQLLVFKQLTLVEVRSCLLIRRVYNPKEKRIRLVDLP